MNNLYQYLAKSKLFSGISEYEIKIIFTDITYKIADYQKGYNFIVDKDNFNDLIVLLEGKIKGEMISVCGKTIRMREIESSEIIAPFYLFSSTDFFPLSLSSITDIKLLKISKRSVLALLQRNEKFLENYLRLTSDRFIYLSKRLEFLQFNSIAKKFAYYLLNLTNKKTGRVVLPLSIKELANFFGVERPSLSKVIAEYVDEEILSRVGRNEFIILDAEKLINIINSS